jgi:hypothetical protein
MSPYVTHQKPQPLKEDADVILYTSGPNLATYSTQSTGSDR